MDEYPKTIVLPISGQTATVQRRLKVRDMRISSRALSNDADNIQRSLAMLAQVLLLNGQPIVMEDLDEWFIEDLTAIYEAMGMTGEGGQQKKSQTEPASPPSSNGDSRLQS